MEAIEFSTKIKDGFIQIPDKFQDSIGSTVKVIILSEHNEKKYDAVAALLKSPVKVPGFTPLSRTEIYERS